jgi:hypothetical protein
MIDRKGDFRGSNEKDRIEYALTTVVDEPKTISWIDTFDKVIDEVNPMYVPHVHEDVSDPSSFEIGKLLASGLTHSGAHLHEGNTLLCQSIASPLTNKYLDITTGKIEIMEDARAYYDTSVVTRLLKDYYRFAKEGVSGPAYIISSRSTRKKKVDDEDEELKAIHVDKGILPTQTGTVDVKSKDVNVAKKVATCVIAFSAAACQFEEAGYEPKDVIYNLVHPDPRSIDSNSELLLTLEDVPLYDFSEYRNRIKELRRKKDRTLVEDGAVLFFDGIGTVVNGSTVNTMSERNDVMNSIQSNLMIERLKMHHRILNLGNRILITEILMSSPHFEIVEIGKGKKTDDVTTTINEEFIGHGS